MPFQALGLAEPVVRGVRRAGYTTPTPVQERAIPLILPGRDLVAAAETGSGKTAAFLLPILDRLLEGPRGLRALILVPTRELAAQVEDCAREYARYCDLGIGCVYGGVPIGRQESLLRRERLDLLVATPGRLLDLHGRQALSFEDVRILVLDEADRMVDMGFAPDLRRILRLLPKARQTLMFSATMPPELNAVARETLVEPERIDLAPPRRPAAGIMQTFFPVPRHLKGELLEALLRGVNGSGTIVFARTKHGAEKLSRRLRRSGFSVAALHGDRSQGQREKALGDFRRGRVAVLVATDIASRGIDVDDVSHVINYDLPRTPEDYVHRIGRTGRMNAGGDALTLVTPEERKDAEAIERAIGRQVPSRSVEGFDYGRAAVPSARYAAAGRGEPGLEGGRRRHAPRGRGERAVAPAPPPAAAFGRRPRAILGPAKRRKRI
jgi:ATP-dependent RNA helicase RhlE